MVALRLSSYLFPIGFYSEEFSYKRDFHSTFVIFMYMALQLCNVFKKCEIRSMKDNENTTSELVQKSISV